MLIDRKIMLVFLLKFQGFYDVELSTEEHKAMYSQDL